MKLEAVMEQLQRQQQARLEMEGRERKDRGIRESHVFYAQQFATQQAALAASSRTPMGPVGRGPAISGPPRATAKSSMDSEPDEEAFEGEEAGSDLEEEEEGGEEVARRGHGDMEEMEMEEEEEEGDEVEGEEEEDEEEYLRNQAAPVTPAQRLPHAHRPSVSGQSHKPSSTRPASPSQARSKSPTGHHEWGFEEQYKQMQPSEWMTNDQCESGGKSSFRSATVTAHVPGTIKQNGSLAWNDDVDGGRAREAAKDFAKLYELDSDPKRKEFLDDLFVFMQKRDYQHWLTRARGERARERRQQRARPNQRRGEERLGARSRERHQPLRVPLDGVETGEPNMSMSMAGRG
ncbi:AT-rich interactive domain-containing protein 3B-like [Rhinoraja longicauda]